MNHTCTRCGVEKPHTSEFFYRDKTRGKNGLRSVCKECNNSTNVRGSKRAKEEKVVADKSSDGVVYKAVKCKRCGMPTEKKYINVDFLAHVEKNSFCYECKGLTSSDDDLFGDTYGTKYGDDTKASELPLMDTPGSSLTFGGGNAD